MLEIGVGWRWRKPLWAATQAVGSTNISLGYSFGANQQDIPTAKTLTTYLPLLYLKSSHSILA